MKRVTRYSADASLAFAAAMGLGLLSTAQATVPLSTAEVARTEVTRQEVTAPLIKNSIAKIDAVFAQFNQTGSPGCALGIYSQGELAYAWGYGQADLAHDIAITSETIFDIASISKQFTAASLNLLAQQGKLSLNDDVRQHIPELPNYGVTITLQQMLNHTSGLRDYPTLMGLHGTNFSDVTGDSDVLAIIATQSALNFTPGSEYDYSSSNYFLVAKVIERVSGKSFRDFVRDSIFQPLQMTHSNFIDDYAEVVPQLASGHIWDEKKGWRRSISQWQSVGATRLHTSVQDLARWDANFYSPQVGGPALVSALQTPGNLNNGLSIDYAQGLRRETVQGHDAVRHGGDTAGYRSDYLRLPGLKLSIAVLCNNESTSPRQLSESVLAILLPSDTKVTQKAITADANTPIGAEASGVRLTDQQITALVGKYRDAKVAVYRSVVLEHGHLFFGDEQTRVQLIPLNANRFALKDRPSSVQLRVVLHADQTVQALEKYEGEQKLWTVQRYDAWQPSTSELQPFVGNYYSKDLDVNYQLRIENGKLIAHHFKDGDMAMMPVTRDEFIWDWPANLAFERAAEQGIKGFRLSLQGAVRNIEFVKLK